MTTVLESKAQLSKYPLGMRADRVSRNAFNGLIDADRLVYEHSSFPLAASLRSKDEEDNGLQALKDGGNYSAAAAGLAQRDTFESSELRFCPECARCDRERYGVAHWRVLHQVSFARHCLEHRLPLLSHCSSCGSAIDSRWGPHFAGDPCARCHGTSFVSKAFDEPPAYLPLMLLTQRALHRTAPELRPLSRVRMLSRFGLNDGSREAERRSLSKALLDSWNVQSLMALISIVGDSPGIRSFVICSHLAALCPEAKLGVGGLSGDEFAKVGCTTGASPPSPAFMEERLLTGTFFSQLGLR